MIVLKQWMLMAIYLLNLNQLVDGEEFGTAVAFFVTKYFTEERSNHVNIQGYKGYRWRYV